MSAKKLLGSFAISLLIAASIAIPSKAEETEMNADTGIKATITEIQGSMIKMTTADGEFMTMFVSPGSTEYNQLAEGAEVTISGGRILVSQTASAQSTSTYAERLNQKIAAIEQEYQSERTTQTNSVSSVQTTTTTTTNTNVQPTEVPVEPEEQPVRALW